jgi:HPr kinase/phosphorylase
LKARGPRSAVVPGGLLRMFGLGVLIVGDSGIGKSESALELIARGHRFVSDDAVQVERTPSGRLIAKAPAMSRFFMEIRGLGIINIKEIFGTRSISPRAPIDLVIRLKKWHRKKEYDRLGLRFPEDFLILGERVPQLNIPVAPGRNIATLIEVACKVHLLRKRGYEAPLEIVTRLERALSRGRRTG